MRCHVGKAWAHLIRCQHQSSQHLWPHPSPSRGDANSMPIPHECTRCRSRAPLPPRVAFALVLCAYAAQAPASPTEQHGSDIIGALRCNRLPPPPALLHPVSHPRVVSPNLTYRAHPDTRRRSTQSNVKLTRTTEIPTPPHKARQRDGRAPRRLQADTDTHMGRSNQCLFKHTGRR